MVKNSIKIREFFYLEFGHGQTEFSTETVLVEGVDTFYCFHAGAEVLKYFANIPCHLNSNK